MARYRMYISTYAGSDIVFESDLTDRDEIIEAFYDSNFETPTICAQCSGWNPWDLSLEIGDEWEVTDMECID